MNRFRWRHMSFLVIALMAFVAIPSIVSGCSSKDRDGGLSPVTAGLNIESANENIGINVSSSLSAFYSDNTGTTDVSLLAVWESADKSVAKVVTDDRGVSVVGVAKGKAKITASYNGLLAETSIEVAEATGDCLTYDDEGNTVSEAPVVVPAGSSYQVYVLQPLDNGKMQNITENLLWDSSDETIATVSGSGMVTVGTKAGFSVITGKLYESATHTKGNSEGRVVSKFTVTVGEKTITSIKFSESTLTLPLGIKGELTLEAEYSDGTSLTLPGVPNGEAVTRVSPQSS